VIFHPGSSDTQVLLWRPRLPIRNPLNAMNVPPRFLRNQSVPAPYCPNLKRFSPAGGELLDRRRFKTQAEARMAVFEFIEGFHNPRRRHSSLGYLSPITFERQYAATALEPGAHEHAVVLAPVKSGLEA
jgi:transposase InsO family protein